MDREKFNILAVNPGGTSTKIALFLNDDELFSEDLRHQRDEPASFGSIADELPFRMNAVNLLLEEKQVDMIGLHAVVGRGGPFAPVPSGVFSVDDELLCALAEGRFMVEHPSLLGAAMANELAKHSGCPAIIVDPASVDEFIDEARITGMKEIERRSLAHTLSIKAAVREAASIMGKRLETTNAVALHLGSGFSVAASRQGRQIDSTDASASGPMAPTRAGSVPALDLVRLACSGKYSLRDLEKKLIGQGGWLAHLGTDDIREIYRRIDAGCARSRIVLDATLLQLAKETAAMAASLNGRVDIIVITGGVARSDRFIDDLKPRIEWLCKAIVVLPGEREMSALARGALSVLRGEQKAISMAPFLTG